MRNIISFHICFLLLTSICFGQNAIKKQLDVAKTYRLTKETSKALKTYNKLHKKTSRKDTLFKYVSEGLLETLYDSIVHLREADNYTDKTYKNTISIINKYFEVYNKDKALINTSKKKDRIYRDKEYYIYQALIIAYNGTTQFEKASAIKPKIYDIYFNDFEEYGSNSLEKYFHTERFTHNKYFIECAEYFNDFNDEEKKPHLLKQVFAVYSIDQKRKINYDSCLFSLEVIKTNKKKSDTVEYSLAKRYYLKKKREDVMEYIPNYIIHAPIDNKALHQIILDYLDNKVKTSGEIIYIEEW